MGAKHDEPLSPHTAAIAVFDLRLSNLANRVTALEAHVERLEVHRTDQVMQLKEMHRDLRAMQNDLHRLIDDRVPLKLLLERAVSASERAECRATEANTACAQVLDHCTKKDCRRCAPSDAAGDAKPGDNDGA